MNWKYYKRWNDIEEILAAFRRWKREDTEKNINGESGIMKKKWNYAETLKETVILTVAENRTESANVQTSLKGKTIPIIAMTANAFQKDVERSAQAGMNAHISKPIDMKILCKVIE
mgnify:CR=1 FL=1